MRDGNRQSRRHLVKLLRFVGSGAAMTVETDGVRLRSADGRSYRTSAAVIADGLAAGLIVECEATPSPSMAGAGQKPVDSTGRNLLLLPAARSFLRRAAADIEEEFLAQHADVVPSVAEVDGVKQAVRLDRSESPLGPLTRLKDRDGASFLPPEAIAAGERLAADFARGQLQPRVTASWEPRLSSSANGSRGGMADIADSAMAARQAVNRAAAAMGPELSGVALDVCCFMKGLTLVERERQWPARSAKLMLRTALMALARHYSPPRPERPGATRHWGADGYRPDWS